MPTLTVDGCGALSAQPGERLVLALERGGVDILHRCGGIARCITRSSGLEAGKAVAESLELEPAPVWVAKP